ncbi:MAG: PD40 domain-containing protein [Chitinophagales bacterium]|nr:PD40 domain-containing protein [Chitinophagales bacterium]
MNERLIQILTLVLVSFRLLSQEVNEEGFRKTFKSELKVVESKLARKPLDVNLNYKYGLLCYKVCKYREAQKALYKCMNDYKDNPYYYLDLYHIEVALKNKEKADEFYYKYFALSKKLGLETNYVIEHQELSNSIRPSLVVMNQTSKDYFPYVLNNGKIKFLTQSKFSYLEPTSPLLTRNYLTNEVVFSDSSFKNQKLLEQPSKTSDGFSFHAFCLNKAQNKIYMTRYDGGNRRMIICVSDKVELRWQPFRTLSYISKNSKANFMHPMLTEDENQMIFASDMKGGNGGYDLWIADLSENDELSKVRNLGNNVNTLGNELFPTKYDDNSFFFSSDGHPGYGSLDLYRCDISNQKLSKPINLGASFNSVRDDYALFYSKDGNTGYFTSNRSVGNANLFIDKIYKIKLNVFDCEILNLEIRNPFSTSGSLAYEKVNIPTPTENGINTTSETQNQILEQPKNNQDADLNRSFKEENASPPVNAKFETPKEKTDETLILGKTIKENIQQNENDHNPEDVQKIIAASEILLGNKKKENVPKETTSTNEALALYETKNDKIEEKFVAYSENESISSLKTNAIVENKFWTAAKLWFKDFNIPISYSYIRVINPKNEVIYSNYSSENGMISVEVVESNEYTIEIPRFRTLLKGVVFTEGDNNFYFPYESPDKKTSNNTVVLRKGNESKKIASNNRKDKKPNFKYGKKSMNLGIAITKSLPKSDKGNSRPSKPTSKPSPTKKKPDDKGTPRNMIENFN